MKVPRLARNWAIAALLYALFVFGYVQIFEQCQKENRARTSYVITSKENGFKQETKGLLRPYSITQNGTWMERMWNTGEKEALFIENPIYAKTYKVGARYKVDHGEPAGTMNVVMAMIFALIFPFPILWIPVYSLWLYWD